MSLRNAARTIKTFKKADLYTAGLCWKKMIEYIKEKRGIYKYIYYIMLFKLLDKTVLSSFHFFLFLYSFYWTLFHTSVSLVYFSLKCVFNTSTKLVCKGTVSRTVYAVCNL